LASRPRPATLTAKGGESGPAVKPCNTARSPLIERVTAADEDERMPPAEAAAKPLSAAEVALLRSWIDQGAPAPADEPIPPRPRDHWSYQPPVRAALPATANPAWVRNPIDAFVAAEHERRGL